MTLIDRRCAAAMLCAASFVFSVSAATITPASTGDGETGDQFAYAVSLDGNTAVVGVPGANIGSHTDQGAAYVYVRSGSTWTLQAQLTPANGVTASGFGKSVTIEGDTVAVGAPDIYNEGAVYIFRRSGTVVWTESSAFVAEGVNPGEHFGYCVALSGTTLAVGGPDHVSSSAGAGTIYVFTDEGSRWTQQAFLTPSSPQTGDRFGTSVAIDGNTIVGGAHEAHTGIGYASVFVRSNGNWTEQAKLTAPGGVVDDNFGFSVAVSTDTAVIGSRNANGQAGSKGAAFVFTRSGQNWTQQTMLTAADGEVGDLFGSSVSIDGNVAVVGSPKNVLEKGAAYVFFRSGQNWTQQTKLTSASGAGGDHYGFAAAVSGLTVVAGAPNAAVQTNNNQGAAFVSIFSASWQQQAELNSGRGIANIQFGSAVALDGTTAAISAPNENANQGAVYLYIQSGNEWTLQSRVVAPDGAADNFFGASVGLSGDTVVVGAPGHFTQTGAAYVFVRSGGVWTMQEQLNATGAIANDKIGTSASISGNSVIVGAPGRGSGAGAAFVFLRSGVTWNQQAELTASSATGVDNFGASAAIFGDLALVGAPLSDVGAADRGSGYVFVRNGSTWMQQARLDSLNGAAGDQMGWSAALNGTTAILGAPTRDQSSQADEGAAYVFVQNGVAWEQQTELIPSDGRTNDRFGWSVALSGNNALVGVPFQTYDGFNASPGSAQFFARSGTTWTYRSTLAPTGGADEDRFGFSVAVSGFNAICGIPGRDVDTSFNQGAAETFVLPDNNTAPTIVPIADLAVNEGVLIDFTVQAVDKEHNTFVFSLEPGAPAESTINASTGRFSFTPTDGPTSISVSVRVTETDAEINKSSVESFSITVNNVDPEFSINGAAVASNGVTYTLTIDAPTDPGTDTITSGTIFWGDGTTSAHTAAGAYNHTYTNGTSIGTDVTISLDVADEDGSYEDIASLDVTVYTAAPSITATGADTTGEGSVYTLTLSNPVTPGGPIVAGVIAWGDGNFDNYTGPKDYTHTYVDGSDTGTNVFIRIDLTDANATYASVVSKKVTITNANPTITISGDPIAYADQSYTLTVGSPLDPGADTISGGVVKWGDGSVTTFTGGGPYFHAYAQSSVGQTRAISIDLSDEDGIYLSVAALNVDVHQLNRAPTAQDDTLSVSGTTLKNGQLNASDPDPNTTLTFVITQQPTKGVVNLVDANAGTYTYQATNNITGGDTFKFKVNDGELESAQATVFVTLMRVNAAPVIVSPANANPSPAFVGRPVTFSVTASDPDNDGLTYAWTFGDGTNGLQATAVKTYTVAGTYTVTVSVNDGKGGTVTSSVILTVNPPPLPLTVAKLNVKLNFAKPLSDSIAFSGTLPAADGTSFEGKTLDINIGGVHKVLALDAKGKSTPKGNDTATMAKPKAGLSKYSIKFNKGNFAASLADEGLVNANVKGVSTPITVTIAFGDATYEKVQPQIYTAKQGKSGATK